MTIVLFLNKLVIFLFHHFSISCFKHAKPFTKMYKPERKAFCHLLQELSGISNPWAQKILASCPNFYKNSRKETRAIPCNNIGHTGRWKWLDTVFQGQYRPSLSINYVAINEHLKKLPPQMYEIKRKICHDQGCSDIRVVIAMKWRLTYYTCSNISHWELFLVYKIVQGSSFLQ